MKTGLFHAIRLSVLVFLCGSRVISASAQLPAASGCRTQEGGNPIVPGIGLTDPHITVHEGRAYLFATRDFSPESKGFRMDEWWVWSSDDLITWKMESILKPEDTFLKRPFKDCWAGFGLYGNNRWYYYFSAGRNDIGVVTAPSASGPWSDPLGKPLLAEGLTPTMQRDPDLFRDDDGNVYLVYGTFDYFIVRLNPDLISLSEHPHPVNIDRRFGPYGEGKTDDKPSLHKYNGKYYLSWCGYYAMSDNVYGPYSYKGCLFDRDNLSLPFRAARVDYDRHGNFFEMNGQWFYAFNDFSHPGTTQHYRDACIVYAHYLDNGEIAPIRLDAIGVGQYDASAGRIEAEDYFHAEGASKRQCPEGGFEIRELREGSLLRYPHVRNLCQNTEVRFRISSINPGGATIEIRQGTPDGPLLGSCTVPETGNWSTYRTVGCSLENVAGTLDICLVFKGEGEELLRLDWLRFD